MEIFFIVERKGKYWRKGATWADNRGGAYQFKDIAVARQIAAFYGGIVQRVRN